ncbi:MAG: prolyl oligopeptidase family serine peptidase, partial [Lewinella sp.]|nr:prolyl oligopeptidase family serine peptidase [Lewinella sp.]
MKKLFFPLLCLLACLYACKTNEDQSPKSPIVYPETTKVEHVDTYHGTEVPDPYYWLEDDMSEETANWVAAENEVTDAYLTGIPFRDALKHRLEELLDYERITAPFKEGDHEYFYKNDGLQNHNVLYRTPAGQTNAEAEVFLDPNTFSEDGTVGLRGITFTKDGSLAAYMITEGGSDWRKIIVINTGTKEIIGDTLIDVKFSGLSWKGDEGFYYSSYDNPKETSELSAKTQHHKLYYHKLGTPQSEDVLVYGGEKQPNRYINGSVTEDGNYLVVSAAQNTSGGQLYVKDLRQPNADFIQLQDDYFARCTYVDNEGSTFYLYTNIDAPNYRVVKVDVKAPALSNWVDVIPESENVLRVSSGGGKLFGSYLVDAKTAIKQFDMDGQLEREVQLPGIGTANGFGAKKEDTYLYYTFTSFTYPPTIYKYDIASGKSELYRKPEVDFDPEAYETKQVFYNSKDGTRVPMFIVYKKGIEMDGKNPTYLYAYGGFNISLTPGFSPSRIVWLENGGIYAQPNLRGGGEYGKEWYQAGTLERKQNVFDDFIAAAEWLITNGY